MDSSNHMHFTNTQAFNFGNEKVFDSKLNILLRPHPNDRQNDLQFSDGVTLPPNLWQNKFWKTKENPRDLNMKNNGSPKSGLSKKMPMIQNDLVQGHFERAIGEATVETDSQKPFAKRKSSLPLALQST